MKELKYLFKFYKKYRWRFVLGSFFVVISNVFALYPAIYTRKAFDVAKEASIVFRNDAHFLCSFERGVHVLYEANYNCDVSPH